ncbi:DNA annealing helicase and endonuclease ZRANB3-like isoform X1 [Carassius gibelio]|uniref:DNA annealing helicase and endonuclease ZRANB3-like isoform X1 n=1 Tax=Carassius gibelio TaxID=101364 RepID=UPI0022781820|nr:DNA annealing helicase and endonuclease ZRANB3-like isoform X1 [Carassius gibelio]
MSRIFVSVFVCWFFGARWQWDCRGASHLDKLHQRLSEIMIRRLKNQVLTQLPLKIRQRIPFDLPKDAAKAGAVKDYIKMMLETEQLKFLVFAHHLSMLQACTEAVIEAKFERNKQHDIRSFFSPSVNKEKKRKRTGDSPI